MVTRTANANWRGGLAEGKGAVSLDSSGAGNFPVSWSARSEQPSGQTSPEELIAAAHATCYNMALSMALGQAGSPPESLDTKADVTLDLSKVQITDIHLTVRADVPGMSGEDFAATAEQAKTACPVSQALAGAAIALDARLT